MEKKNVVLVKMAPHAGFSTRVILRNTTALIAPVKMFEDFFNLVKIN